MPQYELSAVHCGGNYSAPPIDSKIDIVNRENPNLKVVISLRDPVERTRSHHRFLYLESLKRGMGDMNQMTDIALEANSRLQNLRSLALDALNDYRQTLDDSSTSFQRFIEASNSFNRPGRGVNVAYQRAINPIYHSLYIAPIYTWDRIMESKNVLVMEAERVTQFRSKNRLERKAREVS